MPGASQGGKKGSLKANLPLATQLMIRRWGASLEGKRRGNRDIIEGDISGEHLSWVYQWLHTTGLEAGPAMRRASKVLLPLNMRWTPWLDSMRSPACRQLSSSVNSIRKRGNAAKCDVWGKGEQSRDMLDRWLRYDTFIGLEGQEQLAINKAVKHKI